MNPHSTDLARDSKYDYPDGPINHFKDLAMCFGIGLIAVILTLTAVCHADSIDLFFQNVYKAVAL